MGKFIIFSLMILGLASSAKAEDAFDYRSLMIQMTSELVQMQQMTSQEAVYAVSYFDNLYQDNAQLAERVGQDALYYADMDNRVIQRPQEAAKFFKKLASKLK